MWSFLSKSTIFKEKKFIKQNYYFSISLNFSKILKNFGFWGHFGSVNLWQVPTVETCWNTANISFKLFSIYLETFGWFPRLVQKIINLLRLVGHGLWRHGPQPWAVTEKKNWFFFLQQFIWQTKSISNDRTLDNESKLYKSFLWNFVVFEKKKKKF